MLIGASGLGKHLQWTCPRLRVTRPAFIASMGKVLQPNFNTGTTHGTAESWGLGFRVWV